MSNFSLNGVYSGRRNNKQNLERETSGWFSKKHKENLKKNPYARSAPKISKVRYSAMRALELPPEENIKQTKLVGFQCSRNLDLVNVKKKRDGLRFNKNMNDLLCDNYEPCSTIDVSQVCSSLTDKVDHSFSKFKIEKTKYALPTDVTSSQVMEAGVDTKFGTHPDTSNLVNRLVTTYPPNQRNSVHSLPGNDLSMGQDYDLTMKFTTDSEGNEIFDNFTQRHNHACQDQQTFETDEELYCNFKNDLINSKHKQSTQKPHV